MSIFFSLFFAKFFYFRCFCVLFWTLKIASPHRLRKGLSTITLYFVPFFRSLFCRTVSLFMYKKNLLVQHTHLNGGCSVRYVRSAFNILTQADIYCLLQLLCIGLDFVGSAVRSTQIIFVLLFLDSRNDKQLSMCFVKHLIVYVRDNLCLCMSQRTWQFYIFLFGSENVFITFTSQIWSM